MPLSPIAEFILQPIFELALQLFGYLTGRIVVPFFSFGFVRVEHLVEKRRIRPTLKNARIDPDHPRVISADAGAVFGLLFWFAAGFVVYFVTHGFST